MSGNARLNHNASHAIGGDRQNGPLDRFHASQKGFDTPDSVCIAHLQRQKLRQCGVELSAERKQFGIAPPLTYRPGRPAAQEFADLLHF
jgi:hypothetical protein